jgi:hypothetical protein
MRYSGSQDRFLLRYSGSPWNWLLVETFFFDTLTLTISRDFSRDILTLRRDIFVRYFGSQ